MKNIMFFLSFIFIAAFTACQKSNLTSPLELDSPFQTMSSRSIQIKDLNGHPLAGAKVMVGDTSSGRSPIVTDAQGSFEPPTDWTTPETVSIFATGYTRATYYNQVPAGQIFQLRLEDKKPTIEIKGVAAGFDPYMTEKDGNIDFALVIPMMKREELYFFNESQVMSAENDYISIFGQKIPVPSNISLPLQKEKYGFFGFTLDKPIYRLKVAYPGESQFVAIRARTSVKALKDRLPPLELLNEIILGGNSERNFVVPETGGEMNFSIGEKQFPAKISVTAPVVPDEMLMLSLPLVQSGNYLYPSDVKSLKGLETRELSVPEAGVTDVLNVVTAEDRTTNHAASANISRMGNSSRAIQFLGIVTNLAADTQKISVKAPTMPEGVQAGGMYLSLSRVDIVNVDNMDVEQLIRVWELYLDNWNEQILLPSLPADIGFTPTRDAKYRWEVSFLASDKTRTSSGAPEVLANFVQDISYVTRNSVDL